MQFERFLKLVASRIGQLINYSSLASDVGVSPTTIRDRVSLLEATYIIFRLKPYYENFGKRSIKSSKLYFVDTGILYHLLGIESSEQLQKDIYYGSIFENWILLEFIKFKYNNAMEPRFYFYRDVSGKEIDLILQKGSELIPIEIKSSKTYSSSFLKALKYLQNEIPQRVKTGAVIYRGEKSQKINEFTLLTHENCTKILES